MKYEAKILWGMSLEAIDTEIAEIAKAEYEGKAVDRPHMWDLLETKKRYLAAQARLNEQQNKDNQFTEITTETIYNEIKNEEENTMNNTFKSITGITYTCNDAQTRFYTVDAEGKKTRIKRSDYEAAKAAAEQELTETTVNKEDVACVDDVVHDIVMGIAEEQGRTDWGALADIREEVAADVRDLDHNPTAEEITHIAAEYLTPTDEAWEAEAEAERKAREEKIAADAKATEDAVNGIVATLTEKAEEKPEKGKKKDKKEKTDKKDQPKAEAKEKAKKTRKSKDIAHEHKDGEVTITLTAKQVDFVLHLSDSSFWTGLSSTLWCDVLCDEIGGQFEGKPMTIGAMISTLCEKGLAERYKDRMTDEVTGRSRKSTIFQLTEKGKEIAKELGLK